jgi:hypothetical protein
MKTITQLAKVAVLSVAVLFGTVGTSRAQYDVGTSNLNLGIGLGNTLLSGFNGAGFSQTPAIGISFDHGMWEAGDGTISLGGYLGYKAFKYEDSYFNYSEAYKWTYTIIGVRGAYHFPIDNEKLDLYLGAMLSYNIVTFKYENSDPYYYDLYNSSFDYGSGIGFSGFGGIRYYLSDNIGLNAELGYGIGYLTLGVTFKFE